MISELRANPFMPGAGKMPPELGHRPEIEDPLQRILEHLAASKQGAEFAYLYGPRGNGKTVLLTELKLQASKRNVEATDKPMPVISLLPKNLETVAALEHAVMTATDATPSLLKVMQGLSTTLSLGGAGVGLAFGQAGSRSDLAGQMAQSPLLILLDEAHTAPPKVPGSLLNTVQQVGMDSPIALVLAGTPGLEDNLRAAEATFWSRGEQLLVGRLDPSEALRVIAAPMRAVGVNVDDGIAAGLAKHADHYPFFLQVYGAAAWDAVAKSGTNRLGEAEAREAIDAGAIRRHRYYSDRYEEFRTKGELALAREVAQAFKANGKSLSNRELEDVVADAVLADGEDPIFFLRARGYVWKAAGGGDWEADIPSLMDYMIAETKPRLRVNETQA